MSEKELVNKRSKIIRWIIRTKDIHFTLIFFFGMITIITYARVNNYYFIDVSDPLSIQNTFVIFSYLLLILATVNYFFMFLFYGKKKKITAKRIESLEEKWEAEPNETKYAWELAKINLQGYIDKNLNQVSRIFYLSIFVMIIGFSFILYGVARVYDNPDMLNPSILVTCSGVIINFIGATFLIIYRSVMKQASSNIEVLERINVVGMSIQILDSIDDDDNVFQTRLEIARNLSNVYNSTKHDANNKE